MAQRRPSRKKGAPPRKKPSGKPQRKAAGKARAKPRARTSRGRTHLVYDFEEGNKDMKFLLGGKGANLAEMTNLGLPVPPGFTITTDACREFMSTRKLPSGLMDEVTRHLTSLEKKMGRKLGDAANPQLVSVRSGSMFSMPGM